MKRIAEVMITGKTIAGKKRALGEILDEEVLGGIPHHVITAMVDSHMIRVSNFTDSGKEISMEAMMNAIQELSLRVSKLEPKPKSKPQVKTTLTRNKRTSKRSLQ